jgi:hypothetical protein
MTPISQSSVTCVSPEDAVAGTMVFNARRDASAQDRRRAARGCNPPFSTELQ